MHRTFLSNLEKQHCFLNGDVFARVIPKVLGLTIYIYLYINIIALDVCKKITVVKGIYVIEHLTAISSESSEWICKSRKNWRSLYDKSYTFIWKVSVQPKLMPPVNLYSKRVCYLGDPTVADCIESVQASRYDVHIKQRCTSYVGWKLW